MAYFSIFLTFVGAGLLGLWVLSVPLLGVALLAPLPNNNAVHKKYIAVNPKLIR